MTLRITLLALATGLFSLIWIQDRQSPVTEQTASSGTAHVLTIDEISESALVPSRTTECDPSLLALSSEDLHRQLVGVWKMVSREWTEKSIINGLVDSRETDLITAAFVNEPNSDLPLPKGILPGEYRAVSNTGIVVNVVLTAKQLPHREQLTTKDVYETQVGRLRWFFIRVQPDETPIAPAFAERSTPISPERIQKQAGQIVLRAGRSLIREIASLTIESQPDSRNVLSWLKNPLRISSRAAGKLVD